MWEPLSWRPLASLIKTPNNRRPPSSEFSCRLPLHRKDGVWKLYRPDAAFGVFAGTASRKSSCNDRRVWAGSTRLTQQDQMRNTHSYIHACMRAYKHKEASKQQYIHIRAYVRACMHAYRVSQHQGCWHCTYDLRPQNFHNHCDDNRLLIS